MLRDQEVRDGVTGAVGGRGLLVVGFASIGFGSPGARRPGTAKGAPGHRLSKAARISATVLYRSSGRKLIALRITRSNWRLIAGLICRGGCKGLPDAISGALVGRVRVSRLYRVAPSE